MNADGTQPNRDGLADLVRRSQDGDAAALEQLLLAVQDGVHRLALRMTACPDDALDATQEILIRVLTRLSTFRGEASFTTWVHRVAVNHLLDHNKSAVERAELTFDRFADDLVSGLAAPQANADPAGDILARDVKHGCTLALLTCLPRDQRVTYILGEVFEVSSAEGAWICATSEAAYRQRLSRARQAVRQFVQEHCGLVSPERAQCHCRRRVPTAVALGRVDPASAARATAEEIAAAVQEIGTLYDAAGLLRSLPDARAPEALASRIKALIGSGRYRVLSD